ncbi:hypothetical protein MBRA1_003369 [Malassezia brasiliensis]|uniref:Ras-GAP domain-containing protein n=1 Tax=Malassezia brasiliensis TaxID=1821822 RepID=A0AAF0IR50_9BASI|nr:hypothetical protein MBRA1_003369 [Malassezia brasiliensis]
MSRKPSEPPRTPSPRYVWPGRRADGAARAPAPASPGPYVPAPTSQSATVRRCARQLLASVMAASFASLADAESEASLQVLVEESAHDSAVVVYECLNVIELFEVPPTLDHAQAGHRLYRLLCLVRVLDMCLARYVAAVSAPAPAPLLPDALVAHLLDTVCSLMQALLLFEGGALPLSGAEAVAPALSPSADADRTRAFNFGWKDTEAQRERECEYALLDAHEGVWPAQASPVGYFQLAPRVPPDDAWTTRADECDAPPRVVAAFLYRALARLVHYVGTAHPAHVAAVVCGALQRAPTTHDELRTAAEIRLMECAPLDLATVAPLAATALAALGKRALYPVVSVALRRALFAAPPHEAEWASGVFDALLPAADSHRRRTILWPTLAALLAWCPRKEHAAAHAVRGARRDAAPAKKALFAEALVHHLSASRLGLVAAYALCTACDGLARAPGAESRALGAALLTQAAPRVAEWVRAAAQLAPAEARLAARFLGLLLAADACRAAARALVHAAVQTVAGALLVVHALFAYEAADAPGAQARIDELVAGVAPALRAQLRAAPGAPPGAAWASELHPPGATLEQAYAHAVLHYALRRHARTGAPPLVEARDALALLDTGADALSTADAHVHHAAARVVAAHAPALDDVPRALLASSAARILHAPTHTALRHATHALAYLVPCVPRGAACDAQLTAPRVLGAAVFALCVLDAAVHRAALALGAALGAAVCATRAAPALVALVRTLPRGAGPDATVARVVAALDASAPAARVVLDALLARWQPLVAAPAGAERALRTYARVLACAADASCDALVAPLAALVLRGDAAASDAAHELLAAVPDALVERVVRRVRDTSVPDTRTTAARWLWLLDTVAHARASVPARGELAEMLAQCAECAAPAACPEARVRVCRTARALGPPTARAGGALALRILPWADAAHAEVRAAACAALGPLLAAPVEGSDALDASRDDAVRRRLALYVHGLLRAARRADGRDAEAAVGALAALLRRHPAHVQQTAARLVLRAHPAERAAVLRACAAAWDALPDTPAPPGSAAPGVFAPVPDALPHDVARALAHVATAPLEAALAGVVHDEGALVGALLGDEIARCADEASLLRANSPALAVASAFLRRALFVCTRHVVRAAAAHVGARDAPLDASTPAGRADVAAAADALVRALAHAAHAAPNDARRVCAAVRAHAVRRFPGPRAPHTALGALVLLRVVGPALATPASVHVALPDRAHARADLVLLSKVLLALAHGGFAPHHAALAPLNAHLRGAAPHVAAALDRLCAAAPAAAPAPRPAPLADRALLAAQLAEHAPRLVQTHPALADAVHAARAALAVPTPAERVARARDAAYTYDALRRMHRGRDAAALHAVCYDTHAADGRRVVCYAAARVAMHRADLAHLAHHVLHVLGAGGPCDVLVDLTGATEAHLPPLQWAVYVLEVAPPAVLAHVRTLVVLNAGTPVRHYLRAWAPVAWPGRVAFATSLAEVAPLAPAGVLPASTLALLPSAPPAAPADDAPGAECVVLHDGRTAPALATLRVLDTHVVLTTVHPVPLGTTTGRTCDVLALADVWVACEGDVVRLDTPTDTLALWHASAAPVPLRAAAAALLRAAAGDAAPAPAYPLPGAAPAPAVPSAAHAAAIVHTTLDLCARCGEGAGTSLAHLAPLLPRLAHAPHVDARALLAAALLGWAVCPALRATWAAGVWAPLAGASALYDAFLDACVAVAPTQHAAPLLHAVLDALAARALHDAAPAWRTVAALVPLCAVRTLVPPPAPRTELPVALGVALLLAPHSAFLHEACADALHHAVCVLQRDAPPHTYAPLLARLAHAWPTEAAPHAAQVPTALARAAHDVLACAAPGTEAELGRLVAIYATHGAVRAQALRVLAALPDGGARALRTAARALPSADADVAGAAAQCAAAHLGAAPHHAPALLWAGLALVQRGDAALLAPGTALAHAAAAHLGGADAAARLLAARHAPEAAALDAAYGVHAERDVGFALATVLRTPLTTPATARLARDTALHLLAVLARGDGVPDARQCGLLLALSFTQPRTRDEAARAARLAPPHSRDVWRTVPAGSAAPLALALGASLVPRVDDDARAPLCDYLLKASEASTTCAALLHGPLAPFLAEAAEAAAAVPALRTLQRRAAADGAGAPLLAQLGFAALLPHAPPPPAAAVRAWLERVVASL